MEYQCVWCENIFDEDNMIMTGVQSGWGFLTSTVLCKDCYDAYVKSKKSCSDCKYWKTKRKNEPCKNCKNHSNWESKLKLV